MTQFQKSKRAMVLGGAAAYGTLALGIGKAFAQQTPGVTDKEIRLGAWMPLTGPVAPYGVPFRAGVESCIGTVNAQGGVKGRKLVYTVEDNAYNPQRTVAAARKLISRDDVFCIASPFGTAQSAAAFDYVLTEAKVPIVNPWGGAADWYTPPKDGLYGAQPLPEAASRVLGRWAAKDGHKNIMVIYGALASFEIMANNVILGAKPVRSDVVVTNYPVKFGSADYGPIALDLANKKPDALVLLLVEQEVTALVRELKNQGFKPALYGWTPIVSNALVAIAGPGLLDGMKATSFVAPTISDSPAIQEYRSALAKYAPQEKPDFASLTGYGLMKTFIEALRRIDGPPTRAALIQSLNAMRNYDSGILPLISYSPERHLGNTYFHRAQLVAGQWTAVGTPVDGDQAW